MHDIVAAEWSCRSLTPWVSNLQILDHIWWTDIRAATRWMFFSFLNHGHYQRVTCGALFCTFRLVFDQLAQLWIFQDLHFRGRLAANENLSAWWMENTGRAVMSDVISDITWINGDQYFISIMIKHRMRVTAPDRKAWLYNECRNCTYLERSRKARSKSSEAYVWSVRGV